MRLFIETIQFLLHLSFPYILKGGVLAKVKSRVYFSFRGTMNLLISDKDKYFAHQEKDHKNSRADFQAFIKFSKDFHDNY